ncbi:TetR/AcrR family transcriptional regulator [Streptomyces fuscigenes]|uniref:TetR/AcrR family transcriptional regulator n=1 Tax=Streptomyces fuscigenes TaxID=1528880 RepID=UPI001F2F6E03|nr:TetR/AcrR family transcriptional regulator [Streptomyces fuscigenes]MCF3963657.1 TetR/AcrR family transcriptional regulator [Streptomyces fuscigenes]
MSSDVTAASETGTGTRQDTSTGRRPGGRSARVRAAVHAAVVDLLAAEGGGEGLTLPLVAARAGVHATTLYRRWGSVAELLGDVASSRFSGADGELVVPDTGSLRGDLRQWAVGVATDLSDPDVLTLMRATIGSGEEGGCLCRGDRMDQLEAMLERERERGGETPDAEHAADILLAPLYYRALFTEAPGSTQWAASLVDNLR